MGLNQVLCRRSIGRKGSYDMTEASDETKRGVTVLILSQKHGTVLHTL